MPKEHLKYTMKYSWHTALEYLISSFTAFMHSQWWGILYHSRYTDEDKNVCII